MKVINEITAISELPIPVNIQNKLYEQLILPFNNSETDAQYFWHDYPTQLVVIEPSDTDASIQAKNPEIHRLIHRTFTTSEFVKSITSDDETYLLALLITGDDGAGFYLLVSTANTVFPMFQLTSQLDEPIQ